MADTFRFTARDWNGKKVRGELAAADRGEALEMLQGRNLVLLELKKQHPVLKAIKQATLKGLYFLGYRAYTSRELMIFCRQFATMLRAGINVMQCLEILSGQKELAALRKEISTAAQEVERGGSLSSGLQGSKNSLPPLMISMVEAGEASGKLDLIMDKMAEHFEKQHDFNEKIRSATLYPCFMILVSVVVLTVMVIFVLPQFSAIFNAMGMEMPLYTRFLLTLVAILSNYKFLFIAVLILSFLGVIYFSRTEKGRRFYDRLRLDLPFIGTIYTQTLAARFARTMSTLLASGINLHSALLLTDKVVGNVIVSDSILTLSASLHQGEGLSGPMRHVGYFPTLLTEMVRIGEETGNLDHTLESTAQFYEKEVSYVVERLGTILEPVLLLIVGLFIGLLVFSILSPMYRVFEMM